MKTIETAEQFERPFPALTPAQRYHLEVHGYVVVPETLDRQECGILREALQKLKRDLRAAVDGGAKSAHGAWFDIDQPHHSFMAAILEADPAITAYANHPRIVGMAEELIGGEARLVEFNAHINSRPPGQEVDDEPKYGFHRGIDAPYASHTKHGLNHCLFVKTLTCLTDIGPDDGGTVVVAGSHKMDIDENEMIACAYADRSLIHQMVAPAGSTLLFCETLIHATGQIRSDRERAIIIGGFGAAMMPWWDGGEMSDRFRGQIPERLNTLFNGKAHWTRAPRYRTLAEPVDPRTFKLKDAWWPELSE